MKDNQLKTPNRRIVVRIGHVNPEVSQCCQQIDEAMTKDAQPRFERLARARRASWHAWMTDPRRF